MSAPMIQPLRDPRYFCIWADSREADYKILINYEYESLKDRNVRFSFVWQIKAAHQNLLEFQANLNKRTHRLLAAALMKSFRSESQQSYSLLVVH